MEIHLNPHDHSASFGTDTPAKMQIFPRTDRPSDNVKSCAYIGPKFRHSVLKSTKIWVKNISMPFVIFLLPLANFLKTSLVSKTDIEIAMRRIAIVLLFLNKDLIKSFYD